MVQWLACLTATQEVLGSIPGYTLEIFLEDRFWNGLNPASWEQLGTVVTWYEN